ncbi:SLC13 family permease [Ornithobacterium rhinotracheale]
MQMYLVIIVLLVLVVGLATDKVRSSMLFLLSALVLMVFNVLDPKTFLSSFANKSIAIIFVLILLTSAINFNYNIVKYLDKIFTQENKPKYFLFQTTSWVSFISAFMNNTPIVALMIPYITHWSKRHGQAPSKFLIPLSYAAITGGMLTTIGTSTNLVLNGFIESRGIKAFTMFDFLLPGLVTCVACLIFMVFFAYKILPARKSAIDIKENLKEYLVEISLKPNAQVVGHTVEEAGLRNLLGVYLVEIFRDGKTISPVSPQETLQPNDLLFFAGDTQHIVEIVKEKNGFVFPKTERFNLKGDLKVVETLIPYNSNLAGRTLKESRFREKYDAAVIAIHRNGERLRGKLGEIRLAYGDLLMLTTGEHFAQLVQNNTNIYVLEEKDEIKKIPFWKSAILLAVSVLALGLSVFKILDFFVSLLVILSAFFALKMYNSTQLKNNLNIDLFLILGSSIAIGTAFMDTGGAKWIGDFVLSIFQQYDKIGILIGVYLLTLILTSFVTNVAAISIVFPIAFEISRELNMPAQALFLAIAFGASCAFITPFGYQTNLMIYGVGGYKFKDFIKIGVPMTVIYSIACLGSIALIYHLI